MNLNKFVFVVCGGREHVDTLHFSLRALSHFSSNEIWVVTDSARNEIPVIHPNLIDIHTPEYLNHHQSSIYLKTSLYKILPPGNQYCYLDTDVVALSKEVDEIFYHKTGDITFAPDHCRMHQFSPYAVNCGCLNQNVRDREELNEILRNYVISEPETNPVLLKEQLALKRKFELIKRDKIKYLQIAFRYALPGKVLHLDEDIYYDKLNRTWFHTDGIPIMHEIPKMTVEQIEKHSSWRWNTFKRRWISPRGADIHELQCDHLRQTIEQKFDIKINNKEWQHWNGGVFLFDDSSKNFMRLWHSRTMRIFKDPQWKTRDQGTLIATAWQLGLQNSTLLSKKFNFIADPSNPRLMISENRQFISDDAFETKYAPAFIHIFHRFGEKGWDVWDWVSHRLESIISGPGEIGSMS